MRPAPARPWPSWPEPVVVRGRSGLPIVVLERPGPVVAIRLTAETGARNDRVPGASHGLEHLLFRTREGAAARQAVEAAGGEMGATTTREQLSIDVVVLPADLPVAFEALRRVLAVELTPTDLERERPVILREIAHEAEERRLIWQLLAQALYGDDHPLARPILGTPESVGALTVEHLAPARARLGASTAALAAVGPVSPGELADLAAGLTLEGREPDDDATEPGLPDPGRRHVERRSDLLHLAVGWRFEGLGDPRLPALRLAEIVLAHGSGSRLYRRLRTERRLAYRVSTILIPYRDVGHVSAVTSCDPHHAAQAETAIVAEVERLAARGPSLPELDAARRQHAGMTARRYESSRQLAAWAASQLLWDRPVAVHDSLAALADVTPSDIRDACVTLLRDGHAVASVGRLRPRH